MFDLSGNNILVFGGTGTLMSEISHSLVSHGANVIIVGRNKDKVEKLVSHENITFYKFDIQEDSIIILFDAIYKKYKYINMLINGAGINSSKDILETKYNDMLNLFHINFFFVVRCSQIYIEKTLQLNKPGKILNIGSISGITPLSKVFMYSASKAALHNFSKNIAREYGDKNITTNILVPGFFPAEQNREILSESRKKDILDHTPLHRFGEPNDLCGMVLLLASNMSNFINGSELVIDGGFNGTKI